MLDFKVIKIFPKIPFRRYSRSNVVDNRFTICCLDKIELIFLHITK